MQNLSTNTKLLILIFFLIFFGIYLSFIGGYGSDEDTLAMVYVFQRILYEGIFATSRFTGYPVAEIGIGFLSHFFGSWLANLITFLFLIFGLFLFYFSLNAYHKRDNLYYYFLLLCLSNPILYFDNIEPMDYSWAFFFFALGTYFLKKEIFEIAVVLFGVAIGTRLNFGLFIIIVIFFFNYRNTCLLPKKIGLILSSIFIGCLFYLPIWYYNQFSLDWVTAARPLEQGYFGLFFRVLYKTFLALGGIISIFIIYQLVFNYKIIKTNKNFKLCFFLILSNLLVFFWIPAELSYLQIFLICIFYLVANSINKKVIIIIILLNLSTWFLKIDFIEVTHRYKNKCKPIQAISAEPKISFNHGYLYNYFYTRDMIKCFVDENSPRGKKIIEGKALK